MLRIGHFEAELAGGHAIGTGGDRTGNDVHAMVGKHTCHVRKQVSSIQRLDLNLDHEQALGAGPFDFDHTLRLLVFQIDHVLAVGAVHGYALITGDEADDIVTGHRHAATGQLDPHIAHALDGHAGGAAGGLAFHGLQRQDFLLDFLIDLVGTRILDQMRDDVLRGDLSVTNGGEHGVRVREVKVVGHTHQCFGRKQCVDRQIALAHRAGQLVAALLDGFSTTLLGEPLTNLVAGLRTLDEAQPIA